MEKLLIVAILILVSGCSPVQLRREWFGLSVQDVSSAKDKSTVVIDGKESECFEKICAILTQINANIKTKDTAKYFITADEFDKSVKSCVDTTEVGILIKPAGSGKSRIEVASGNHYLAEAVCGILAKKIKEPGKEESRAAVKPGNSEPTK